jgi:hypothetical protein
MVACIGEGTEHYFELTLPLLRSFIPAIILYVYVYTCKKIRDGIYITMKVIQRDHCYLLLLGAESNPGPQ